MEKKHICACCGKSECGLYDEYTVCPVCGWAYDIVQEEYPDMVGGCNKPSLNQARAGWMEKQKSA